MTLSEEKRHAEFSERQVSELNECTCYPYSQRGPGSQPYKRHIARVKNECQCGRGELWCVLRAHEVILTHYPREAFHDYQNSFQSQCR
jgi:hypothetical protein